MGDNIGIVVTTDISGSASGSATTDISGSGSGSAKTDISGSVAAAAADEDGSNISKSLKHYAAVRRMLRTFAIEEPEKKLEPEKEPEQEPEPDPDPNVARVFKYKEVETQFQEAYVEDSENYSAILDMIAVYLKGQKILYTEAKTLCEIRLNYLMLPAIFVTALCSILSLVLKDYGFGATIVSCLNGGNAFILALISYLKLDARAESHRSSAYKFDKLQSSTVFSSGRALFGTLSKDNVIALIEKVEKEVTEIKESNQFVLPELIRVSFPHLYGTNVFAEVKTIMNESTVNMERLRNILNDREIARVGFLTATPETKEAAKIAFDDITDIYRRHVRVCIQIRERYKNLDKELEVELSDRIKARRRWSFNICACLKN